MHSWQNIFLLIAHGLGIPEFLCICMSDVPGAFHNMLEGLCLIWSLSVHLSMYAKLDLG